MKQYRIVKETKETTGTVEYFIERRRKLFGWVWWTKLTECLYGIEVPIRFKSYKQAKKEFCRITEKTIKEVITTKF